MPLPASPATRFASVAVGALKWIFVLLAVVVHIVVVPIVELVAELAGWLRRTFASRR